MQTSTHSNFAFLSEHNPKLAELADYADRYYTAHDWNTCVMKFRQLGELLAQLFAAKHAIYVDKSTSQSDLLKLFRQELHLDKQVIQLFHTLRIEGNQAVHISFEEATTQEKAQSAFLAAWQLAHWFHRLFGKNAENFQARYKPLVLQTWQAVPQREQQLEDQVQQDIRQEQEKSAQLAPEQVKAVKEKTRQRMRKASMLVELSEKETRELIDSQLREAGWEADSKTLHYGKGVRPEMGRNLAIAEYSTKAGNADYVLFVGLTPIAVVEAKKANTDVAGKITQAERYAKNWDNLTACNTKLIPAWQLVQRTIAWADEAVGHYSIPFVYSCNGRPYLRQLEEKSGTWFRDVRDSHNIRRALQQFHTPEGLLDLLKRDREQAEKNLDKETFDYLHLRDYQVKAIQAVEYALAQNHRTALLAMATGTGKTRTIAGLIYRFLKTERFKRILFLVDRTSLGTQAFDTFSEMKMEQNYTLNDAYNIATLTQSKAERETRIQLATVQAMVKRLTESDEPLPIDEFDCIIVDEAHRGYTLDQEMSEGELAIRDSSQYISAYRQVLDYFDAVKIALTATPAKHTTEIFGKPVYTYSYREAVADDWLIDYEPPIRYQTQLSEQGIHFDKGETVDLVDMTTGELDFTELEDELDFDVESFNRNVINENFNRVICQQLVNELDPFGEEKTLIFCANDHHADQIKRLLDEEFSALYSHYNQAAVEKITGKSDNPEQLINHYKNERYPNIAITVDLLSTGIDVPKICNLVFLRRVKSRILFEQMLGRATRRCDEIGKTAFRIYDPVDIYDALQDVNTMKPLVKNPNVDLEQLVGELSDSTLIAKAKQVNLHNGQTQADELLSELTQKIMRTLRRAERLAEKKPEVRQILDELHREWGIEPKALHQHLHTQGLDKTIAFLQKHSNFIHSINHVRYLTKKDTVISTHEDVLRERFQDYNGSKRPQDYLDSFNHFISANLNSQVALTVALTRPSDLTREQLKDLRRLLDDNGFTETTLNRAFSSQSNQDIAAGIVAHIRRAALGESLIPFSERAEKAMQKLYANHPTLTPVQKCWLDRLKKQLVKEVTLDRQSLNEWFAKDGGANQFDKLLDEQLEQFLAELRESMWDSAA